MKETFDTPAHRTAIADLIYTYARHIRHGEGVECVNLFTEDGVFEIRDAPLGTEGAATVRARLEGHQQIGAYLSHGDGATARVCPVIGNLMISIDGHRATANSVLTATVWPDGKRIMGEYNDSFAFEGIWRFSVRRFDIFGEFGP